MNRATGPASHKGGQMLRRLCLVKKEEETEKKREKKGKRKRTKGGALSVEGHKFGGELPELPHHVGCNFPSQQDLKDKIGAAELKIFP